MAKKESKSREERVMGLLKEMEKSIVNEESQTCKLLYSIEEKLRHIVSDVDLKVLSDNKCDSLKKFTPTSGKACDGAKKFSPPSGKAWTSESRDSKRPWSEADRTKKIPSVRSLKLADKKLTLKEKQSGDGVMQREGSDTSVCSNSSKVQQLKLFWDKFFLTETESVRSRENLIDKSQFLSEAKYEVLEKPKRKSMRKSAARILEKTIPPSRVPISFRMIPSKLNRPRRKIEKDDDFSDADLILSRDVSTYVAKIPESSEDSGEGSEACSDITLSDIQSNTLDIKPATPPELPTLSDHFKEKLYQHFLSKQIADLSSELSNNKEVTSNEDNKKIYQHVETGRQIGCAHKKGCVLILKGVPLLHCYAEYVAIRREDANIIDPSGILTTKRPERKQRKITTLLPCYYFSVENDQPIDLTARGDSTIMRDGKNKEEKLPAPTRDLHPDDCRMRTTVSYEKITFSSTADLDKSQFKLIISKEEPVTRLSVFVIFTFSSVTIIGFIVVALNFFRGSLMFC